MTKNSGYFPYTKNCYFCDNPIERLCTFRVIDKEFASQYFPKSVYGIFRGTKLSLCEMCADDCQRFYSAHVPKLMCDTFGVDYNKLNQNKKNSSIAKCLLGNKCKSFERPKLEKMLEDTMGKSINDINLQELAYQENLSWKHELGKCVSETKDALQLVLIVSTFFAEHKEYGTITELGKMSSSRRDEHEEKKLRATQHKKEHRKKQHQRSRENQNKKRQLEKELVGHIRKERYENRIKAETKFRETCDFAEFEQYLLDEFDSLETEFETLLENATDDEVDSISDRYKEKIAKLGEFLLNEEFKHNCFLNGNIEDFKNQELQRCDTLESVISLEKFIEHRKKDYERIWNVTYDNKKRKHNDDLNDNFIPFKK